MAEYDYSFAKFFTDIGAGIRQRGKDKQIQRIEEGLLKGTRHLIEFGNLTVYEGDKRVVFNMTREIEINKQNFGIQKTNSGLMLKISDDNGDYLESIVAGDVSNFIETEDEEGNVILYIRLIDSGRGLRITVRK